MGRLKNFFFLYDIADAGRPRPTRAGWAAAGAVLLIGVGVAAHALRARHLFLADMAGGVHLYLADDLAGARTRFEAALRRRPGDPEARELLVRTLMKDGLRALRANEGARAANALEEARRYFPAESPQAATLAALAAKGAAGNAWAGRDMPSLLYERLSASPDAGGHEPLLDAREDKLLNTLAENQIALETLRQEQAVFRRWAIGTAAAVGALLLAFGAAAALFVRRLFGRRGLLARLLEYQSQSLATAAGISYLPDAPHRPEADSLARRFPQIDAIEVELLRETDAESTARLLKPFLEDADPWVRARAAKACAKTDGPLALAELRKLAGSDAAPHRVAAAWALADLASPDALAALLALSRDANRDVQGAAVRGLIQLNNRPGLPADMKEKMAAALASLRAKTDWVL